jgi:hypothetical protein
MNLKRQNTSIQKNEFDGNMILTLYEEYHSE